MNNEKRQVLYEPVFFLFIKKIKINIRRKMFSKYSYLQRK